MNATLPYIATEHDQDLIINVMAKQSLREIWINVNPGKKHCTLYRMSPQSGNANVDRLMRQFPSFLIVRYSVANSQKKSKLTLHIKWSTFKFSGLQ